MRRLERGPGRLVGLCGISKPALTRPEHADFLMLAFSTRCVEVTAKIEGKGSDNPSTFNEVRWARHHHRALSAPSPNGLKPTHPQPLPRPQLPTPRTTCLFLHSSPTLQPSLHPFRTGADEPAGVFDIRCLPGIRRLRLRPHALQRRHHHVHAWYARTHKHATRPPHSPHTRVRRTHEHTPPHSPHTPGPCAPISRPVCA